VTPFPLLRLAGSALKKSKYMASAALLFHTVRHLRPTQIVSRAYYRVADRLGDPSAWRRRLRQAEVGECCWRPCTEFLPPQQQGNSQQAIRQGRFRFQNDERDMGRPIRWDSVEPPMLWRYHLHYFDYLWSLELDTGRELALDWIDRHPIGRGQVGWDPYPTSLRLLNWCAFFFGKHREQSRADSRFVQVIRESIGLQAERLSRRLEYHLLGNHLLENAAALACVGSCFDGSVASRCLNRGLRLLARELDEQILPDGLHFELSPMYHSRVLYLLLMLMNVASEEVQHWLRGYAARMLDAMALVSHPDGEIALLNDSAFEVYPALAGVTQYAGRFGISPPHEPNQANSTFVLKNAGYFGARTEQGHYLICDAGKVGPDYIPGHAHGDIFSFELSLFGDRIVVDSGVYDYTDGDLRRYCRSTAAHNTVEIDGQDQCEFWDAFKMARRARLSGVEFREQPDGFTLRGRHDGYRRLPQRAVHYREFVWRHEGSLVVRDRVDSNAAVPFVSRIHLHPKCRISEKRETGIVVERGGRPYSIQAEGGRLQVAESWYCPEFGVRERACVIELIPSATGRALEFSLAPY
jgi:uncharacterized heparinase superfamily protein